MPRTPTMGTTLAQEKTAWKEADRIRDNIKANLGRETLFSGQIEKYVPDGDTDDPATFTEPDKITLVQLRIEPELFSGLARVLGPALNLTAAKEWGNQGANADLVLDAGTTFADVPATLLLNLEHQLKALEGIIKAVPVLTSAKEWTEDTTTGVWRSVTPDKRNREENTEVPSVGSPPTQHQPAVVKWLPRRVKTGVRETVSFSGAIPPRRKEELLTRLSNVMQAVHSAREQANQAEAPPRDIGTKLLEYLFA